MLEFLIAFLFVAACAVLVMVATNNYLNTDNPFRRKVKEQPKARPFVEEHTPIVEKILAAEGHEVEISHDEWRILARNNIIDYPHALEGSGMRTLQVAFGKRLKVTGIPAYPAQWYRPPVVREQPVARTARLRTPEYSYEEERKRRQDDDSTLNTVATALIINSIVNDTTSSDTSSSTDSFTGGDGDFGGGGASGSWDSDSSSFDSSPSFDAGGGGFDSGGSFGSD